MVPGSLLGRMAWKRGVDDLIDTIKIRHAIRRLVNARHEVL